MNIYGRSYYTRADVVYTSSNRQEAKSEQIRAVTVNKIISLILCRCTLQGCILLFFHLVTPYVLFAFIMNGTLVQALVRNSICLRILLPYFLFSLSFSCFLARCLHPSSLSSFCSCPFRLFPSPSSSSSCSPFPLLLPLFLQLLGHYRHYLSLPKFRLSINLNYPIFFLPVLLLRSGLDNIYIYFFSFGKFPLSLKSIRLRE